jgi:hypothetical protein
MATDPEYRAHQEWIGFLQPEGLVVSAPALCAAQAHVNRNIAPTQQILIDLVRTETVTAGSDRRRTEQAVVPDLRNLCVKFLGWQESDLAGAQGQKPIPESLHVGLSEYGETLKPDYAVPDSDNQENWLLLIKTADTGTDFDAAEKRDGHEWHASVQARFERLLRETDVPVGLLFNGTQLRLVYAPRGERKRRSPSRHSHRRSSKRSRVRWRFPVQDHFCFQVIRIRPGIKSNLRPSGKKLFDAPRFLTFGSTTSGPPTRPGLAPGAWPTSG